eukprot:3278966-Prymnesium_polylepis.1
MDRQVQHATCTEYPRGVSATCNVYGVPGTLQTAACGGMEPAPATPVWWHQLIAAHVPARHVSGHRSSRGA